MIDIKLLLMSIFIVLVFSGCNNAQPSVQFVDGKAYSVPNGYYFSKIIRKNQSLVLQELYNFDEV